MVKLFIALSQVICGIIFISIVRFNLALNNRLPPGQNFNLR